MRKIACLIVLFGLLAVPASAQRTSGAIRGTVTDSSGAVIPGATVTAKSEGMTGATGSDFRIIIGPAKLLGNAVARSTQPFGVT